MVFEVVGHAKSMVNRVIPRLFGRKRVSECMQMVDEIGESKVKVANAETESFEFGR
jgi:hypothetical protein